jgi:hypothetical protein
LSVKNDRNIGKEILEGLREIKRGETGRVINVPPVSDIRRKVGLSQARFACLRAGHDEDPPPGGPAGWREWDPGNRFRAIGRWRSNV